MRLLAILVAALLITATVSAEDPPSFRCQTYGRAYTCVASYDREKYTILPLWILHTKKEFRVFGDDFRDPNAPKNWTELEMRAYPDDQSGSPYDGVAYYPARVWVRLCGGAAKFAKYIKGSTPHGCGEAE